MGPRTQLWDPDFVGVDGVHNEIYVTSGERVLVFNQQANGDVAPLRIIEGPDTRLGRMRGAPQVVPGGELMVVSAGPIPGKSSNRALLIFNRTANGNVKPLRAIEGVGSDDFVISPKGWILIGGSANQGARGGGEQGQESGEPNGVIRIWSVNDNGNVPPRWIVGGPRTKMNGDNLALNPNAKEVIVHKGDQNGMAGYSLPEIF